MPSKLVSDRNKAAVSVSEIGTTQSAALAEALEALIAALAPNPTPDIDWQTVTTALLSLLPASSKQMLAADDDHIAELGDDGEVREDRDAKATALYDAATRVRALVEGVVGERALAKVGISGQTPPANRPDLLSRFGQELIGALERLTLPAPSADQLATFDKDKAKAVLSDLKAALDTALRATAREDREAQASQEIKDQAIDRFDRVYRGVTQVLAGLFVLAGKDALADRVRPADRASGHAAPAAPPAPSEPIV